MATNGYLSAAQLAAKEKKEEEFRESIKPPILIDDSGDEVEVQDDNFFKVADDEGKFQIYGGGNIVVTGSGDTWVISDVELEELDDFTPDSSETSPHPWLVSLFDDGTGGFVATILEGLIYDGLLSVTKITPTLFTDGVVSDSLVCLEYNYSTGAIQSIIVQEFNYEPSTDDGLDPPTILTTVQPIAKIVNVDGVLTVEQIARNNFALTSACINGKILVIFSPL